MAWRIEEAVVRGEIDNRTRGRVVGRLWLAGRDVPVTLDLEGDGWRDIAGRKLEFVNAQPKPADLGGFTAIQRGCVGDITASRKVKVPDIPMDQIGEYYARKQPWPWHWGNSLYLEWFSATNGRVVIESAGYERRIVGEPAWEMTEQEETRQREKNGAAITGFIERLGEALVPADPEGAEDKEWNARPQSEAEAEAMQERSDRLADRINARMEREGDEADFEKILEEELERKRREEGRPEPTPEQLARNAEWIDEMNASAAEALTQPDPELESLLRRKHPLAQRAFEFSLQVRHQAKAGGWLPADAGEEHPVAELEGSLMKAGAKLAGALNGREWPPNLESCAGIIVRLKRARVYLDDALRALESCQEQQLVDSAQLGVALVEIVDLANDADELIAELRTRLERGTR